MTPRKLLLLYGIAFLVSFATVASSDAHVPTSNPVEASATPTGIRSRIDIGPIRELVPIIRRRDEDEKLSEFLYLVEDPNGILSQYQASVLADDAHRLTVHGIPTMFVLRESSQTQEESVVYADQLRFNKKLETTPGADDGMLFLVTRDGETSSRSMYLTISVGSRTLPKGRLNETTLQEVYQQSIRPRMRFGLVADALRIGIRKFIYLETYYPDPAPSLTSLQERTRSIMNVAAPILSVAGLASVVLSWISIRPGSSRERRDQRRRHTMAIVLGGGLIMTLASFAIYSRSESGVLVVVIGVLAIAAHIQLLAFKSRQPRPAARRVRTVSHLVDDGGLRARLARSRSGARRPALWRGPGQ